MVPHALSKKDMSDRKRKIFKKHLNYFLERANCIEALYSVETQVSEEINWHLNVLLWSVSLRTLQNCQGSGVPLEVAKSGQILKKSSSFLWH